MVGKDRDQKRTLAVTIVAISVVTPGDTGREGEQHFGPPPGLYGLLGAAPVLNDYPSATNTVPRA